MSVNVVLPLLSPTVTSTFPETNSCDAAVWNVTACPSVKVLLTVNVLPPVTAEATNVFREFSGWVAWSSVAVSLIVVSSTTWT